MTNRNFMDVEDLEVYKKLCGLPIDVCDLTHKWPQKEKYELVSVHKWSFCPISALCSKNNPRNINYMPAVIFFACLDLEQKSSFMDGHEIGSQSRRSSNSTPAQLAEKNDDRHIRNKIEGVNRARGEAAETIHHLFMAKLKGYITEKVYLEIRGGYKECIGMLNGLEKTLEWKVPE
ncbi:MAG: hypothetical protein SRB2_01695 [Desulfobacteraceae bacterium Eth-SRB2]|nr:MAG: hypothetical protein SRB2_01695 [Desulfobacteraceae bacterium Eth-SRB2]